MKFDESNAVRIDIPKTVFVYFLLDGDEVVYVGQTKNGMSRPLQHTDKVFDSIYVIYCDVSELDYLEDKYMTKYRPKYNKQPNHFMNISLSRARDMAREEFADKSINLWTIKRAIREIGIKPTLIDSSPYIKRNEYEMVIDWIGAGNGRK
jgi:hypothetical protein